MKLVQKTIFSDDWTKIQKGLPCSKPIRQLASFLDQSGVIRVGGRLKNANLGFSAKHPMLLPLDLVIQYFHIKYFHPGRQLLQHLIAQQFWILFARRAIRHTLSLYNRCFRTTFSSLTPYMADLPAVLIKLMIIKVNKRLKSDALIIINPNISKMLARSDCY